MCRLWSVDDEAKGNFCTVMGKFKNAILTIYSIHLFPSGSSQGTENRRKYAKTENTKKAAKSP